MLFSYQAILIKAFPVTLIVIKKHIHRRDVPKLSLIFVTVGVTLTSKLPFMPQLLSLTKIQQLLINIVTFIKTYPSPQAVFFF